MITRQELAHIAFLTRLSFTEAELDRFTDDVSGMLAMVEKMNECPVGNTTGAAVPEGYLRPDTVEPGISREALLKNAALHEAGCFVVPKTVEAE